MGVDESAAKRAWDTSDLVPDTELKINPLSDDNDEDVVFNAPSMFKDSKLRNFRTMTSAAPTQRPERPVATTPRRPAAGQVQDAESPYLDVAAIPPDEFLVTQAMIDSSKWKRATNEEVINSIRKLSLAVSLGTGVRHPSGTMTSPLKAQIAGVSQDSSDDMEYDRGEEPLYDSIKFSQLMEAEEISFKVAFHGSTRIECKLLWVSA